MQLFYTFIRTQQTLLCWYVRGLQRPSRAPVRCSLRAPARAEQTSWHPLPACLSYQCWGLGWEKSSPGGSLRLWASAVTEQSNSARTPSVFTWALVPSSSCFHSKQLIFACSTGQAVAVTRAAGPWGLGRVEEINKVVKRWPQETHILLEMHFLFHILFFQGVRKETL